MNAYGDMSFKLSAVKRRGSNFYIDTTNKQTNKQTSKTPKLIIGKTVTVKDNCMLIIKLFTQNNVTTKIYSTSNLEEFSSTLKG